MNIDERLDRLTERHEALTQSIELMMLDTRENTRNIATLSLVVRELSQHIAATSQTVQATIKIVQATSKTVSDMAASVDTLGRIAEIHEHRLDHIEGNLEGA